MKARIRAAMLWLAAIVLTVLVSVYQRVTGPTYAVRGKAVIEGNEVAYRLPRSHDCGADARISIRAPEQRISGVIEFRRLRSLDDWTRHELRREQDQLIGQIPHQPPAGQVEYRLLLGAASDRLVPLTREPLVMRFKGAVPPYVLVPHIVGMVAAMLLSARAGLEALVKGARTYPYAWWTAITLLVGGLVFGPIVQKYAFGTFWTGWPIGRDLTDNKTAVAWLVWLVAVWWLRRHRRSRAWPIVAALVMLIIWLIPHSLLGSELAYAGGPQ